MGPRNLWDKLVLLYEFFAFSFYGLYLLACEFEPFVKLVSFIPFFKIQRRPLMSVLTDMSSRKTELVKVESDQYVIITGANSGIGFETARVLSCEFGYNVILACRSEQRGNEAKDKIQQELTKKGKNNVVLKYMKLDLCSLDSVKGFVEKINQQSIKVKLLINNAGVMMTPYELTKDGHELQFGCNYLAHILLCLLLKDNLAENGPDSRIVFVSSEAHHPGYVDLSDPSFKKRLYDPCLAYSQSKMLEIMFTYHFSKVLKDEGLGVSVNAIHPGIVSTNIGGNILFPFNHVFDWGIGMVALTPIEGAVNQIYVACAKELEKVSGKYFVHCLPAKSNVETYDPEKAKLAYESTLEHLKPWL